MFKSVTHYSDIHSCRDVACNVSTQKGFSLIEIIVTLLLLSIMVVIGGFGVAKSVEGYFFAQKNSMIVQTAQVSIGRLLKEFDHISEFVTEESSSSSVKFSSIRNGSFSTHEIGLSGNTIKIDGDILTDNISNFEIKYFNSYDDSESQLSPTNATNMMEFTLTFIGPDNFNLPFTARVIPRNLGISEL